MKVPIKWLKDYVNITMPVPELAKKLTLAGFEVSEIITTGGNWDNVFVGEIKAINPHPNADKLRLAAVNLGDREQTVVCGAPNLFVGDKIAFAVAGAKMMDAHTGKVETLKPAKIRGVESSGMICSERELGISENHEGILVLKKEAVPGTPLADFMGQTVLNIDVTANRPDGLSVIGIAREAAAICRQPVIIAEPKYPEAGDDIDKQISIEIKDSELCPRYCATLIKDVKIKNPRRGSRKGSSPAGSGPSTTSWILRITSCWSTGNPCTPSITIGSRIKKSSCGAPYMVRNSIPSIPKNAPLPAICW